MQNTYDTIMPDGTFGVGGKRGVDKMDEMRSDKT